MDQDSKGGLALNAFVFFFFFILDLLIAVAHFILLYQSDHEVASPIQNVQNYWSSL